MRYTMRLRLCGNEIFFGPGVEELLLLVDETGSLHMAAARMEMSYSKAWKMLKAAEKELSFPILERQAGGAGGGFSRLTPQGRDFLDRYSAFRIEARQAADGLFEKYFASYEKAGLIEQ